MNQSRLTWVGVAMILAALSSTASATLIAHYAMDEGQGTVLHDSSGYGHHGTISGASWTSSPFGAALAFDGVNDFVTIANSDSLNITGEAITTMAWIKWDIDPSTGNSWASIMNMSADNHYRLHHNRDNTAFEFAIRTTEGRRWVIGTTVPEMGRWFHVAGTYDGSALNIYVDGLLEGSVKHSGALVGSSSPLNIGNRTTNDRYFAGDMADLRIYDHALTAAELSSVVPEPKTFALLVLGGLMLLGPHYRFVLRRRPA